MRSAIVHKEEHLGAFDLSKEAREAAHQYHGANAERYFEPARDEIFDPS